MTHKEHFLPDHIRFILCFILFAVAHSLFATNRVKQWISGALSGREIRSYRFIYNIGSMVLFVYTMATYRNSPVLYFAPGIWSLILYAAQIIVAALLIGCLRQTGMAGFLGISQLRSPDTSHALITSGYYARVRHPLYFYSLLFMIINPVMTAQWLLLTVCSLIYFIIGACIEERRLLLEFGEEYRYYQQQVPFLIPALHSPKLKPSP